MEKNLFRKENSETEEKIIEVMEDDKMSFWKKKNEMCWGRDIIELSKLIKEGWKFK
jgi:hypothetical protein